MTLSWWCGQGKEGRGGLLALCSRGEAEVLASSSRWQEVAGGEIPTASTPGPCARFLCYVQGGGVVVRL